MVILQWCKMQIIGLLILGYVGAVFIKERKRLDKMTNQANGNRIFDALFAVSEIAVLFDGITACTVNFPEAVPDPVNRLLHFGMFASYEIYVTLLFWYWLSATVGIPGRKWRRGLFLLPCVLALALTAGFLPELRFCRGEYTNYSMGRSVYVCFVTVGVYFVMTVALIVAKNRYIAKAKRHSLATVLICIIIIVSLQYIFPEFLVSGIAIVMITISIYINMENPTIKGLKHYHREMVTGFSTLVENKDDNTGGHIRRSSAYAVLIAENLRHDRRYRQLITRDFLNNLEQSAPMHDVGKIGIPDAILQKPGRLTPEEFEQMKQHTVKGGRIIESTFGHLGDGEYESMAYDIAMYHHEKWNGKGYPCGLAGEDIPVSARIMAVADVFDAVSAKRCYRDAMPLEQCYAIIRNGRGTDFCPEIVDAFLMDRNKVEQIYHNQFQDEKTMHGKSEENENGI